MKNVSLNSLKAFTYIELLFSLFICILILSILPTLFKTTGNLNEQIMNSQEIDLAFFSRDFTQDLIQDDAYIDVNQSNHQRVVIKNKHKSIVYQFVNKKIIKTINGKGNITLLYKVGSAKFKIINDKYIVIYLKILEKGNYYEKKLIF
ncbi:competence type IV pilus minor pilin ComGF [Staphylococcus edaphicus]|uniref:Competence protein n=1 Tax=Staphylococcus edaphicus TaxID=1955013 RepID=A0A2C6WNW6_9STAP|nr:competence type IV pilus minor pilin ComGF [Staphylococcus edaphicus]PHK49765.1 competence protein [Staphylococcus edaphicus]UQW80331.1 ComGF family competence protein [Staphylococcus edaphicus]